MVGPIPADDDLRRAVTGEDPESYRAGLAVMVIRALGGSVELGGDGVRSITWLEVVAAKNAGKPVFAFLLDTRVPWDQANHRHVMRLVLIDADGAPVTVETDDGTEPLVFFDDVEFEVGRPAGVKPGTPLDLPLAVNSGPLPLDPGVYEWRLTIDGLGDDDWRLPFTVRDREPED